MAPKLPAKVTPPPSESESEVETSSEEETPKLKAASSDMFGKNSTSDTLESSSQSGSDDEAETESESNEGNLEPMVSKAMQQRTSKGQKQEKPKSTSVSPRAKPLASIAAKSVGKRVASENEDGMDSKKAAKKNKSEKIVSKPMQQRTSKGQKQEKPKLTSVSPQAKPSASIAAKSVGKRVASENEDGMDSKKAAKKNKSEKGDGMEEESTKTGNESKKLFQRVWNEDDEIALLKGMVDFSSEKGADPCANMIAFYEFIKKSLHFDVSKVQLADKIRRLKRKYENNFGRSKNGKNPTFSKPHEERTFELSNKVWGGGGVSERVVADNSKSKKDIEKARKKLNSLKVERFPSPVFSSELSLCVTGLTRFQQCTQVGLDEQVVRRGVELMEPSKRAELEERWMVLQKNDMELAAKKAEMAIETARAIWEAYDDSSNN